MTLRKLEIQQMLREMNVKFHADETYEALKQRLQQENHSLWLKSVSGNRNAAGGTGKSVVRKRKKETPRPDLPVDPTRATDNPEVSGKTASRTSADRPRKSETTSRAQPIEKPAPGQPWKAAADGTEPFNRKKNVFESVLRRARKCCECCGAESGQASAADGLEPYHILPVSRGGEHSIKNVVALCSACRAAMENDPDPKTIRDLKRKTRSKLYGALQVVRKKTVRTRRPSSGRQK